MTVTPQDYAPDPFAAWVTSDEIDQLAPAFVAALGEMKDVTKAKTANAGTYQYRYADLADVLGDARPILAAHGLALFQVPVVRDGRAEVTTTVWHASGQWLRLAPLSLPAGETAQSAGSAITYARRYSGQGAVGVASEDDDGAAASRTIAGPVLMAQSLLDRFRERAVEEGFDGADIARIVAEATDGRTRDVEQVWESEVDALSAAFKAHTVSSGDAPEAAARSDGASPDVDEGPS